MSNLVDVWFTGEQLRTIRFALKDYRWKCGYVEGEEIDSIVEHINHILDRESKART
jgi:hypothetical protein